MRLGGDRGEGPLNYLAVVLLVATVAAAITVVALPTKVTGSIQASVCRVFGARCDDQRSPAGNPSGTTAPPGGTNTGPEPVQVGPGADPEYQNAVDAYNRANQEAASAESEWGSFDLLKELAALGFDFLFGDIINCIKKPNLMDCLWAIVGIIPWGKIGKFLKAIPKLAKLAKRFIELKRRLDKAREARKAARKRLDDIIEACKKRQKPGNSFAPGTQVLLADGRHKPIEQVRPGDFVWATDPVTGRSGPRAVTALITGYGLKHLVDLAIDPDGLPGGPIHQITATANHPFWTPASTGGTWLDAGLLHAGDQLQTPNGPALVVAARERTIAHQRVHNLAVAGLHTYHVLAGTSAVLVHNDPVDPIPDGGACEIDPPEQIKRPDDFPKDPPTGAIGPGNTAKFRDHFQRHKGLLEDYLGKKYRKFKEDSPTFLSDLRELINKGDLKYAGPGSLKKDTPWGYVYRNDAFTLVLNKDGSFRTLLKRGEGLDLGIILDNT